MNKWLVRGMLVWLAVAVLLAGCGKSPNNKKVSVAMIKLTSSAPIFIGMEKGFFREEGIEIDPQWFEAAQPVAVATASNKVDVGATGITAGLFNMAAGGQTLAIVADKGREQQGFSSSTLLVGTELYNQGVRQIKDLKGKRIGITQTGSTFHYMIGRLLEQEGLGLSDVELVPLNKLGALMAALESRQVDAIILNEPNTGRVLSAGYGKMIAQVGDKMAYQTSAIFFSPDFAKQKDISTRFMKGYIKSVRYYYDAVLTGKKGPQYDEVIKIIAKYTGAPETDITAGLPYIDRDGRLLADDIKTQIDWYAAHKMIEKPLDTGKIVDTSAWLEALSQLGQ